MPVILSNFLLLTNGNEKDQFALPQGSCYFRVAGGRERRKQFAIARQEARGTSVVLVDY